MMHDGFNLFVLRADRMPIGQVLAMFSDMPDNSHVNMRVRESFPHNDPKRASVWVELRFAEAPDAQSALYRWLESFVRAHVEAPTNDLDCALFYWVENGDAHVFGVEHWVPVVNTAVRHEQEEPEERKPATEEMRARSLQAQQYEEQYGWMDLRDEQDREEALQ